MNEAIKDANALYILLPDPTAFSNSFPVQSEQSTVNTLIHI